MRLLSYTFSVLFTIISLQSYAKNIALSFDDGVNPTTNKQALNINNSILHQLHTAKIQSIIFPSYIKIGDTAGKALIADWGHQGHLIGNHSAYHQNLNKQEISSEAYIQSIQINEQIFKDLPNYTYLYRFPFLKEGNTVEKRDAVQNWLKENHYKHGAVSIDASDWFYNLKYLEYVKNKDNSKVTLLKQAYLQHLLDRAQYYDNLAIKILGRSPDHVLLLHTNAINSAFLNDVIEQFKLNGWTFISAQQAFKDPLYDAYSKNTPAGESAIWSIAKTKEFENLRYPAEDAPYEIENLKLHGLD